MQFYNMTNGVKKIMEFVLVMEIFNRVHSKRRIENLETFDDAILFSVKDWNRIV